VARGSRYKAGVRFAPIALVTRMPDYEPIVAHAKLRHAIRVRRWRRNMTGCAWRTRYRDGSVVNWIESPYPRTPISLSIFLHEVGHHVIGFDTYRLRCEEEFHAWDWSVREMRRLGVEPDAKVLRRFELSMRYAVDKAVRRGLKRLPTTLLPFIEPSLIIAAA
jgi:hypothetical protein